METGMTVTHATAPLRVGGEAIFLGNNASDGWGAWRVRVLNAGAKRTPAILPAVPAEYQAEYEKRWAARRGADWVYGVRVEDLGAIVPGIVHRAAAEKAARRTGLPMLYGFIVA